MISLPAMLDTVAGHHASITLLAILYKHVDGDLLYLRRWLEKLSLSLLHGRGGSKALLVGVLRSSQEAKQSLFFS